MAMMANSISDTDLADIAAYFSAEGGMPSGAAQAGRDQSAAQLYLHGDAARGIAACAACHGADGQGVVGAAPVIGGQGLRYLAQQLANWRSGERVNSAGGVMNQAAKTLSDAEIEALAQYVAGM